MSVPRIVFVGLLLFSFSSVDAAPFLEGTVTDEEGRPVAGVSVKIWDCIGTCLGGKAVLTDSAGHYVFETKPFRNFPSWAIDLPGRYEVSRTQTGPELNEPDSETPRRIDSVLGTPADATIALKGDVPEGWKQSLSLRSGRGVSLQRYDFQGTDTYQGRDWQVEMLPRNEPLHIVVVREPVVEESDDRKVTKERQQEARRKRVEILSPPFRLVDPQRYHIQATVIQDAESEALFVVVDSIHDALGADRTAEFVVKDPFFGPPVDETLRAQALALLERVAEAAKPWNASPLRDVESFEYDFIEPDGNAKHVSINQASSAGPSWNDIARLRGFAYMPPLRWLFSQPENIVFHAVEIGDDRATLRYRLKEGRGFTAGFGIGPKWGPFFSSGFSTGTMVIDVANATVLEHRLSRGPLGEEAVEMFSDYVAVGPGFAPQSLRIQSNGHDLRLVFRIHKDRLWLLDTASLAEEPETTIKIENVVVNVKE
jgi:hypothetical protein